MAQLQLGVARCRERKYAQAIAPLRRAIELQPDAVMAHYEMGIALFETGDWKTAAGHFEIVAAKMPKFADARFSLGSVYARIDRVGEAVTELKAALELEPRHYRANLLLGRILTLQGQAGTGVPYLQRAAEAPVVRVDGLISPVIIESLRLLKKDGEHFAHVRSKDGAEGVSVANPPRPEYLDKILKQLVMPFFAGKDARDLENLLWELYRWRDNYKLQGLALWSPQAWVEFAVLDMLGRIARKPMGALLRDVVRQAVACYVASGRRDTTPEEESGHLRKLLEESAARAVKFRVGGRMSRNADASFGRTEKLIPLVRTTFGDMTH